LNELNVTGTFFINGRTSANLSHPRDRAIVKKAYQYGHQIASHTYTHNDLSELNATQVKWEMLQLEDEIYEIIGVRPRYMRPPYGRLSDVALKVIQQLGYRIIVWNIDTNDW
jgi:peptidoglycan/xylan/chitin deacetylase (PgdA/CDA1 family)